MAEGAGRPLVEALDPPLDPVDCCERLAHLPYRLFLDSASKGVLGRYSFLAADPVSVVRSKGLRTEVLDRVTGDRSTIEADALTVLRRVLAPHLQEALPDLPPFQGGAAGYIAYDWGSVLERLPAPRFDDLELADVVFAVYDWVLAWDHENARAWLISTGLPELTPAGRGRRAAARAAAVKQWLRLGSATEAGSAPRQVGAPLAENDSAAAPDSPHGPVASARSTPAPSYPVEAASGGTAALRSSFTHGGYLDAVARVREYIFAGDIFQANLSQRFDAPLAASSWSLYRRLRTVNPAPFAAFVDFPEAVVLSSSPERFLRVDVNGRVETRPIKGTRPRGVGPEHDAALGQALVESSKDRAENLMIVDLMRNDLSRVCRPGTVRVSELFALEHYATVHHLVSTVVGELAPGFDAVELLRAAFPGGSITGAPKIRAMEIIAELEPSRRGVYCGAIGYWSVTGALDTNIAIRTAVAVGDRVYFSAGGGIVADSDPEQEYQETMHKVRGMIEALTAAV